MASIISKNSKNGTQSFKKKYWKCKEIDGTYYHMWWTCGKAKEFWIEVNQLIQTIGKYEIASKPEIFLLNIMLKVLDNSKKHIIIHTVPRLVFAQMWKCADVPNLDKVIEKIYDMAEMDNIEKIGTFWKLFYDWVSNAISFKCILVGLGLGVHCKWQ